MSFDIKKAFNPRKLLLACLLGLCFLVSYDRIHEYYIENYPLGKVNSCYSIRFPDFKERYQLKILANDNNYKKSKILVEPFDKKWYDEEVYTYFELRLLDPKRMDCK